MIVAVFAIAFTLHIHLLASVCSTAVGIGIVMFNARALDHLGTVRKRDGAYQPGDYSRRPHRRIELPRLPDADLHELVAREATQAGLRSARTALEGEPGPVRYKAARGSAWVEVSLTQSEIGTVVDIQGRRPFLLGTDRGRLFGAVADLASRVADAAGPRPNARQE